MTVYLVLRDVFYLYLFVYLLHIQVHPNDGYIQSKRIAKEGTKLNLSL